MMSQQVHIDELANQEENKDQNRIFLVTNSKVEEAIEVELAKKFEPLVKRLQLPLLNDIISTLQIPGLVGQNHTYKIEKQVKVIKFLSLLR